MPPSKQKVFVITTGGTIEKIYDEESGTLTKIGRAHV